MSKTEKELEARTARMELSVAPPQEAEFRKQAGVYFRGIVNGMDMMGGYSDEYLAEGDDEFLDLAAGILGFENLDVPREAFAAGVAAWKEEGSDLMSYLIEEMLRAFRRVNDLD